MFHFWYFGGNSPPPLKRARESNGKTRTKIVRIVINRHVLDVGFEQSVKTFLRNVRRAYNAQTVAVVVARLRSETARPPPPCSRHFTTIYIDLCRGTLMIDGVPIRITRCWRKSRKITRWPENLDAKSDYY